MIGVREKDGKPEFLLKGIPPERIDGYLKDVLNKWRLIQIEYPSIVEVANFSLEPDKFFPYAQIDIVEFPNDTGDCIREKSFKGPLHQQLREALLYIQNSVL